MRRPIAGITYIAAFLAVLFIPAFAMAKPSIEPTARVAVDFGIPGVGGDDNHFICEQGAVCNPDRPPIFTVKDAVMVFTVNGFHQIAIYEVKKRDSFEDAYDRIDTTLRNALDDRFIDDSKNRVYIGILPVSGGDANRTEEIRLRKKGRYLIVCSLIFHFDDPMRAFLTVE